MLGGVYSTLGIRPPQVITVDPYGSRPYEGAPYLYDEDHYGRMTKNLAPYTNHIHYMMDSELFRGDGLGVTMRHTEEQSILEVKTRATAAVTGSTRDVQ